MARNSEESALSRRVFLGALVGSGLAACAERGREKPGGGAGRAVTGGPAGSGREPGATPQAPSKSRPWRAAPDEGARLREAVRPPVAASADRALARIRAVKLAGPQAVLVSGKEPEKMVRAGLAAMGGVGHYVRRGDVVVLTPNYALARPVDAGATTNPELVREVIALCKEAGAREIICLDHTYHETPRAFRINGAYQAVQGTGARLLAPTSAEQYVVVNDFARGTLHRTEIGWQAVAAALLRCDVLINLPVFKHHREAQITGALKKMMGCVWRRMVYHQVGLEECIAELALVLRPSLTVMDGTRFLTTNGPDGPGKVIEGDQILLAADPVRADAYACRWLGLEPVKVRHLARAAELTGSKLEIEESELQKISL